jgi:ABC-2 type transport system permease protein
MKEIQRNIRLTNKIITTLIKDRIQYPGKLFADSVSVIVRCGILLVLYYYVFKINNGVVNGTTFLFASWSILFYFLFATMQLKYISRAIMQDVQSGSIETLFNKPISYLSYRMWWQIGSGLYSFFISSLVSVVLLYLFVGIPETMKLSMFIPTLITTFIFGMILFLLLYSIIGLLSFWIEDINPVYWIVDKAVMILGGSYLPVALFPDLMYKFALYSPFGASLFLTHTVYESWQVNWYSLIAIQSAWTLVLGLIVYILFSKAKKRVSVNGG